MRHETMGGSDLITVPDTITDTRTETVIGINCFNNMHLLAN